MKKYKRRKELWATAKFLIIFNLLAIPMYIVLYLNLAFIPLQNFIAYLSYEIIKFFGYPISLSYYFLTVTSQQQNYLIEISVDSTGWKTLYVMFALAVATPFIAWKNKIKFLVFSLPFLFVLNLARIVTTIVYSLNYGFQYFDVVHTFLWREGLIFAVLAIWFLWLRAFLFKKSKK